MTGIVLSKDSHGDSVKNTGDEGLQKLGQEAGSHAPSFSEEYCFKIDGAEYTCEIQCNECKKRKQNENKAGR